MPIFSHCNIRLTATIISVKRHCQARLLRHIANLFTLQHSIDGSTALELRSRSQEVHTGSQELRSGSQELRRGSQELRRGSQELRSGSQELRRGSLEVRSGSQELRRGSLELRSGSQELRRGSLELRSGSQELCTKTLELGTGSTKAANIRVIQVKPALDLWKNDLEKLVPTEVTFGPKGTKLIKVKPAKESIHLVQTSDAELNDSQLKKDFSQMGVHYSKEEQEKLKEPKADVISKRDDYRSSTDTHHTMCSVRIPSTRRCLDNSNNNVDSCMSTITLPESSFKLQPKPHRDTMFCIIRDKSWRQLSTSVIDKTSKNKNKTKKGKVKYTKVKTFIEPIDEKIKKKKCKNILKRFNRHYSVPGSNEIDAAILNISDSLVSIEERFPCPVSYKRLYSL
ncbi:hypothetical protein LOTGIDRAFT_162339 [Lottia gigantea]|uniref:Uncharacterized protein n=1 Tax=Lottia gigantea TaxID=225164 RepID=V4A830_LOTGI|nr:hypothetical protein LOTGIDRAFT_162339 [Lottia gigantea]ESO92862.1 hypothetical protein LOTGIDRAFT_162339 [Lottia gigantea]